MIRTEVKRTNFFSECNEIEQKKYFSLIDKKFLHNIDTLYYSVFLKGDNNENDNLDELFYELECKKQLLMESKGKDLQEVNGLDLKLGTHAMMYNYRLQNPDRFDIFLTDYLPNKTTPRIVVQLRSYGLWLDTNDLILESFKAVKEILSNYNVEIEKTQENRIDYAYHTNSIQNAYSFFSDKNLDKYLYTSLTKYYKIGDVKRKSLNDFIKTNKKVVNVQKFTLDYFALGQLKSNNVFNRNYNKTREVVELGYKRFFIDKWHEKGLISFYDKYCLEFAYKKENYNSVDLGRLKFYLEYGKNEKIKNEINLVLADPDVRYDDIRKCADLYLPNVTVIMNIEFQTKRKFYYYADTQINDLFSVTTKNVDSELNRLFKILDNREVFLDYLTSKTVAFIKEVKQEVTYINRKKVIENKIIYMSWWTRLRSLKIKNSNVKYKRDYSNMIDQEKMLKKLINSTATNAVYKKKNDTDFVEDIADTLCELNDNDVRFMDLAMIDRNTGEILEFKKNLDLEDYKLYKKKKYKAIKNRLPDSTKS